MEYQPYFGPAGPTEAQQNNNTKVLQERLEAMKIKTKLDTDETPHRLYVLDGPEFGNGIGYDRWGFCDDEGNLDQASLTATIQFVINSKK